MSKRPQMPLVCHGHERPVVDLAFSPATPDGVFLTSASKDGRPMLRNGETGDWIGTFQGHKGAVWACILNDTATIAATASADFSACVWNAITGDEVHKFSHGHIVRTLQLAHTKSQLITAGHESKLRLYDLQRPDAEPAVLTSGPDKPRAICLHTQDDLLLMSYLDKPGISVWDLREGTIVNQLDTQGVVTSIEMQPDGSSFFTADGHAATLWNMQTLQASRSFKLDYGVESASYCPAKGKFAAGGGNLWVYLHDATSGEELECNKGHHGPVHCLRFAPDGNSYASGSEDGTIRIWDTNFTARQAADGGAPAESNGLQL